jgi:lipopolysaccharide assembly protein A
VSFIACIHRLHALQLLVKLHIFVVLVYILIYAYTKYMFILIFLLVVGALMVYLAQNNLTAVSLHLGSYIFSDIPLFYIIIGSLLVGLGLAYLMSLVNSIFTAFTMHGKDNKIKQGKSDIVDLTKRIHQLELENERLKNNSTVTEPQDTNAL